MAHPAPRVNAELQSRLGDDPLERILRHLYPVDCQICGKPLGDKRPSLVVVQLSPDVADALLVHTRCSPPAWLLDGLEWTDPVEPCGTWRAGGAVVATDHVADGEEPDWLPAVVVNPGLDGIHLALIDGTWRPNLAIAADPLAPMRDLADAPVGTQRIHNARLHQVGDTVYIGSEDEPDRWWAGAKEERFWAGLEVLGGALLVLTYGVDPHAMTAENLTAIRARGESITEWVSVTPVTGAEQRPGLGTEAAPRRRKSRSTRRRS